MENPNKYRAKHKPNSLRKKDLLPAEELQPQDYDCLRGSVIAIVFVLEKPLNREKLKTLQHHPV
ncbi:MAG TPA: hypothetical protein VGH19_03200 [Verrucomicrobiae bacterium]